MATLTIRNVPEDLHRALKKRAKQNRRSLNQEAIAELTAFSELTTDPKIAEIEARDRMARAGEQIDALRKSMPRFLTAEEIDKAKAYGRR